jgi:hypothetical protein
MDQVEPFKCSANVPFAPEALWLPTAKHRVVVGHDTPLNTEAVAPLGLGLGMTDQPPPFQCCTNVLNCGPPS